MPSPNDVLFRVDAARIRGLSFGHLFRCLALAVELRERHGTGATFVMRDHSEGVSVPVGHGFPVLRLKVDASAEDEAAALAGRPEEAIVVDLPHPDRALLERLVAAGRIVTVIDDLGGRPLPATRIVNGSIVPERLHYPERLDAGAHPHAPSLLLLGPEYAVLGAEFDAPAGRFNASGTNPPSLLVTFGGSDPAGLTLPVLDLITELRPEGDVHIVAGPGFGTLAELEARAREAGPRVHVHHNPPDLAALMRRADAAVAAAGRTPFELARLGVPALLIPSIEHEREVASAFARRGCALAVERWNPVTVRPCLKRLLGDAALRQRLSRAGPTVVDGQGRTRLAALLARRDSAGV